MSTERKTVVTLHKGVDGNRFMEEMHSKQGGLYIPDRSVQIWNEKPESISNYDFVMSMDEARELTNDPRVRGVRWGTKKECGYILESQVVTEPSSYSRGGFGVEDTDRNWALYDCAQGSLGYDPNLPRDHRFSYTLTGDGVDCVVMDDGIEHYHPEFLDSEGNSRVQLIDWPELAGLSNIEQSAVYYSALTEGHGTAVASIIGGNTFGWAREAQLYSMACVGSFGNPPAAWMYGISEAFNLIRGWHQNKPTPRPTIVNMSWVYYRQWEFDYFRYRGTTYTNRNGEYSFNNPAPQFAMRDDRHPVRITSVESDMEDCLDAGMIMVSSAANNYNYIDVPGGDDWTNYWERDDFFGTYHWCQGGTPMSTPGCINVGNVDFARGNSELNQPQRASGRGPGVDLYAPGTNVGCAISLFNVYNQIFPSRPYPEDPTYKMTKMTGTSFSAPQVVGVLAQHMQLNPNMTSLEVLKWLQENADEDTLEDLTSGNIQDDYANDGALNGSANLFLRNPYASGNVARYSGDIEISK